MGGALGSPLTPLLRPADSSDESDSSEDSDIDSETSSALFMAVRQSPTGWDGSDGPALRLTSQSLQKKKTPPKRERKPSGGSSKGTSRPGTPSVEAASTSSTLRAAASKLEQGECWEGPPWGPRAAVRPVRIHPPHQMLHLPLPSHLTLVSPPGKRTAETPAAKRLRMDTAPQSLSGKSTPSSG